MEWYETWGMCRWDYWSSIPTLLRDSYYWIFGEFTYLGICLTLHGIFSMQVSGQCIQIVSTLVSPLAHWLSTRLPLTTWSSPTPIIMSPFSRPLLMKTFFTVMDAKVVQEQNGRVGDDCECAACIKPRPIQKEALQAALILWNFIKELDNPFAYNIGLILCSFGPRTWVIETQNMKDNKVTSFFTHM